MVLGDLHRNFLYFNEATYSLSRSLICPALGRVAFLAMNEDQRSPSYREDLPHIYLCARVWDAEGHGMPSFHTECAQQEL